MTLNFQNKIVFPAPECSYTSETAFGQVVYIPRNILATPSKNKPLPLWLGITRQPLFKSRATHQNDLNDETMLWATTNNNNNTVRTTNNEVPGRSFCTQNIFREWPWSGRVECFGWRYWAVNWLKEGSFHNVQLNLEEWQTAARRLNASEWLNDEGGGEEKKQESHWV